MHDLSHLPVILVLLAAAVIIVALFRKLHASPVLGYLVAGAIIGPGGAALITDVSKIGAIAEFGVVFLLFIIGLELSWERLHALRKQVFAVGILQMLLTVLALASGVYIAGFSIRAAIIIGGGLALSSTALVLQMVADHKQKESQLGRLALAVLLVQDLAVVPLLVMIPALAQNTDSVMTVVSAVALKALLALGIIIFGGRLVLRPLYRVIASLEHPEIFTALTLLVVLGTGWITAQAGLSLALGAFMAGLLMAETEYRHQVEADVQPYKGLFLGLFFMAVGMSVDTHLMFQQFPLILALALGLMALKTMMTLLLSRWLGFAFAIALQAAFLLSQGGEFAFVLFGLADEHHFIDHEQAQLLMMVVTLTMALTPFAASLGQRLAMKLDPARQRPAEDSTLEVSDLRDHVIILGFGRVGQTIAKLLSAENLHYIAIDTQVPIVSQARKIGLSVYYGDGSKREVLQALGIDRASAAIVTLNDSAAAERAVQALHAASPTLPIIARALDLEGVLRLELAGARVAISERFETSLQLGGALLKALSVNDQEISRILDIFRDRDYALTRGTLDIQPVDGSTPYGKMRAFHSAVVMTGKLPESAQSPDE